MPKVLRPEDLIVITDTREQLPLVLPHFQVVRDTLWIGDYSIRNLEDIVVCERKNLSDYISCCGTARNHFEDQLRRLLAIPIRCIVCEFSWDDLEAGTWRSKVTPTVAMATAASWMSKGIPFAFCGSAKGAAAFVEYFLWSAARHLHEEALAFATALKREAETPVLTV